jgi:hypothetical protein
MLLTTPLVTKTAVQLLSWVLSNCNGTWVSE